MSFTTDTLNEVREHLGMAKESWENLGKGKAMLLPSPISHRLLTN
jgi:hypothetical protein